MTAFEIVCDSQADRTAWLEARRTGIGSSDSAGVLGIASVSRWTSPIRVYTDKTTPVVEDEGSEPMKWGRILEPHIIEEFGKDMGRKVETYQKLTRSREWPWMLATCDAQQWSDKPEPGILEVKATGWRVGDWSDGIPEHVRVQAQHQLAVQGWEWGSVAVLIRGMQLLYADIERDEALIEHIVEASRELWERIQKGEPPNPDGSESARKALEALYPEDTGETIALPGELIELDDERERIAADLKRMKDRKEEIDQIVKAAIGDATEGRLANGTTYTHRLQARKGYTVKPAEFRVLRRSGG